MPLEDRLDDLATRVAAEFNTHRAEPHGGGFTPTLCRVDVNTGQNVNTTNQLAVTQDVAHTDFTVGADTVTFNFSGIVTIAYGVVINGSATRAVPETQGRIAGSNVPGLVARHTYIRNASGHTESSANASTTIAVTSGQAFSLHTVNRAGGGTVTVQAGSAVSFTRLT